MNILITGDLSLQKDFLGKFSINVIEFDNNAYIINIPENVQINKGIVTEEHLPRFTQFQSLGEYISAHDTSLKDFITYKTTIIASGSIEKVDGELGLPYDYEVKGDFRIYDQQLMTTYDYISSSQIDVHEYCQYLERMLINSTQISHDTKRKNNK